MEWRCPSLRRVGIDLVGIDSPWTSIKRAPWGGRELQERKVPCIFIASAPTGAYYAYIHKISASRISIKSLLLPRQCIYNNNHRAITLAVTFYYLIIKTRRSFRCKIFKCAIQNFPTIHKYFCLDFRDKCVWKKFF